MRQVYYWAELTDRLRVIFRKIIYSERMGLAREKLTGTRFRLTATEDFMSLSALCALVFQNTTLVLLLKHSFRESAPAYSTSSAVLFTEILKLCICATKVILHFRSPGILLLCLHEVQERVILFVPSMLYVVQNNLLFFGSARLTPVVYLVCTQMKVISTAAVSRILLGTRLSFSQVFALLLLICGAILVQFSPSALDKDGLVQDKHSRFFLGITSVLGASITSGTAGVLLEMIFKAPSFDGSNNTKVVHSVWTRNFQLSLISAPFAAVGVWFENPAHFTSGKLCSGYDNVVILIVFLQATGGLITGYVMKFSNNVSKCFAVSISICICACYSAVHDDLKVSWRLVVGILMVSFALLLYSKPSKSHGKPWHPPRVKGDENA